MASSKNRVAFGRRNSSCLSTRGFSYFSTGTEIGGARSLRPDASSLSATGKRPAGIGTENEDQEIVVLEKKEDCVVLPVTILAAGFVVGPNGASVHQIEAVTGATIYSHNRAKDPKVL